MKFIQELKAAQDFIDKAKSNDWDTPNGFLKLEGEYWAIDISSMDEDHIRNVLRRIPQIMEVVEWIEKEMTKLKPLAKQEREGAKLGELMDVNLAENYLAAILSKLEGKK